MTIDFGKFSQNKNNHFLSDLYLNKLLQTNPEQSECEFSVSNIVINIH